MWETSSAEIGRGAAQQQAEHRYATLAKNIHEDGKVAARLQEAFDRANVKQRCFSARPPCQHRPGSEEVLSACEILRYLLFFSDTQTFCGLASANIKP